MTFTQRVLGACRAAPIATGARGARLLGVTAGDVTGIVMLARG